MASLTEAVPLGMVVGKITATNSTPITKGRARPVTADVLSIVITSAIKRPMRNKSLNCESTRSITVKTPLQLISYEGEVV